MLLVGMDGLYNRRPERSYARKAATEALTQVGHRIEGEISRELQVAETLAIRPRSTKEIWVVSTARQRE